MQNLNFISQTVQSYIFLTIQDGGRRYVEFHGSSNAVSYVVWIDVMNTKFGSNISIRFGDMGLSFCQYDGMQPATVLDFFYKQNISNVWRC